MNKQNNVTQQYKKIIKLHDQFETVTLQLEELEIKRDELIGLDKDTTKIDEKIYKYEDKQYQIQLELESLGEV
jgi:hypothetical protein